MEISQFRFPFTQCAQSILCEGCDRRFSKSTAVYVQNRPSIRKIEKGHMLCNKDYATYETRISLQSPEQTFYEIHYIHELDRAVMNGDATEDIVPASHNIMINQFLTYKEALASTELYEEADVRFIMYEKSYRHSIIQSRLWGRERNSPSMV